MIRLGEHDLSTDTETKTVDVPVVKVRAGRNIIIKSFKS